MKSFLFAVCFVITNLSFAQKNNIKISAIPKDVKELLNEYLGVLLNSSNQEEAAQVLYDRGLISGNLLDEFGLKPAEDIVLYSLKKDFYNAKFYFSPVVITGVTYTAKSYDGYKDNYIEGKKYQIWIQKKDKSNGPPSPITIIKPISGSPKIIGIGSL